MELRIGWSGYFIKSCMHLQQALRQQSSLLHFCLQKALEMMYIVPKKANDMMNVGMLECYTVSCVISRFVIIVKYFTLRTVWCPNATYLHLLQGKIQALGQLIMQVIFDTFPIPY